MPKILSGTYKQIIYYEDTDFTGFVYHANYLKFFDRARHNLFSINLLRDFYNLGHHFVVHKLSLKYIFGARFGDNLIISSTAQITTSPRITVLQTAKKESDNQLITQAKISLVNINKNNRPQKISQNLLDLL